MRWITSVLQALVTLVLVTQAILYVFSVLAHAIPSLREHEVPRFMFDGKPAGPTSAAWWTGPALAPKGLRLPGRLVGVPDRAGPAPLALALLTPIWLLYRSRAKRAIDPYLRAVDPYLGQIRELRKIRTTPQLLAETCDEVLQGYQAFLSPLELRQVLEARAEAMLALGRGMDALTSLQRLAVDRPGDPAIESGLLRAYKLSGRRLPDPMCAVMIRHLDAVRPLDDELVQYYLEQVLPPPKKGSTPIPLPSPLSLIAERSPRDPLLGQLRTLLARMADGRGPVAARAQVCLARCTLAERSYDLATAYLREALRADPGNDEAHAIAIESYRGAGKLAELRELYVTLLQKHRHNLKIHAAIQTLYQEVPEMEEFGPNPLDALDGTTGETPARSDPDPGAAGAGAGLDDLEDAGLTAEERFSVAMGALQQGRADAARRVLEDLLSGKFPRRDALVAGLCLSCIRMKDVAAARKYAQEIEWGRLPPQETYPLAREIETTGELGWALQVYRKLEEETPGYQDIKDRIRGIEREMEGHLT